MADFGLAAQIGRGGGGGNAMAQPADPANQMMRMLQLQNLQQNMMLAREQEAREAALAPLRRQNLETDIRGSAARATVAETQGQMLRTEREDQLRKARVNRGMIDVMDRADRGILDLSSPEGLSSITDPEIRSAVRSQLTATREAADKAQKANLEMTGVQRAIAYNFVDRYGEGITGPRQYQAARDKILKVDPGAIEFLPDNYNVDNAARLRDFVRERKTTIQMVNGVPVMVTEGSPVATELTIQRAAPAAPPPPPAFGNMPSFQSSRMAPDMAAGVAAATPNYANAGQGIIGQRLPAAIEPQVSPAARPATLPASQFVEERRTTETNKGREDVASTLTKMAAAYDRLSTAGGIPDERKGTTENMMAYLGSTDVGQIGGKAVATRAQSERNELVSLTRTLISDMKKATGMSAQELNNIKELELMLAAASNPTQSIQSVRQILNNLNERFGSGKVIEFKSLAERSERPPAASSGRAAPAAAARPAAQRTVTRTGVAPDGRRVVQYSDGTVEYAN
jgi:hypothetical protein